jgi:transcriptional regulator with XRE-family HTH domain
MNIMTRNQPLDIRTLGQRIRYAREAAGLTQSQVAEHFGIKRVSVTQWEGDITRPATEKLAELAELLNTEASWLLEAKGFPPLFKPKPERGIAIEPQDIIPGERLVGTRKLPVYAAAMGGSGHVLINFDAVDQVKMPHVLENVRGGYGILVKGTSMVPAYREDDIALVHPHLAPARDTDCVFYHTPPKELGEAEAMIKHLIGINDREWRLEQYRPLLEFSESRADWPICHRVVGKYNAR